MLQIESSNVNIELMFNIRTSNGKHRVRSGKVFLRIVKSELEGWVKKGNYKKVKGKKYISEIRKKGVKKSYFCFLNSSSFDNLSNLEHRMSSIILHISKVGLATLNVTHPRTETRPYFVFLIPNFSFCHFEHFILFFFSTFHFSILGFSLHVPPFILYLFFGCPQNAFYFTKV